MSFKDGKKDEDEGYSPFEGLDKGSVLQETSLFNDPKVRDHGATIRHCRHLMTKVLYMLGQGETFSEDQATELFFRVTKLFQCKDIYLRRLVYLLVKELADSADQVIIVTNCLQQDINRTENEMFRSNAIRVLCRIIPGSMLGQVERLVKQTITDNSASVASAGLASAIYLFRESPEIVRRWTNEVNNQVMSKSNMVQFHALCLLFKMRANDKIAISKVVSGLTKGNTVRSPLAACVLIRKCAVLLDGEESPGETPQMDFLEVCLRHKNEMVVFEAARAICSLRRVTASDLVHAITVLQMFLSSSKPTLRFAAVRTLNKVAISQPLSVTTCNVDLESLISDSNRSIATLAITTLLKTGSEHSVDRLMKQISNFMSEIADEFKIVVVDAIRSMCIKYPAKHRTMMNFLSSILREEGGYEFKKAIVDSILTLINNIPEVQESGLGHLCEFIEDCEYTALSTAILHLLGQRGPYSSEPGKYIRFIYNRVVLENAIVRASAVCALAKFGMEVESLRPTILELLRRCLYDSDDEVRDRASFYLEALGKQEEAAQQHARSMVVGGLAFPVANLEDSLKAYLKAGNTSRAFDSSKVTKVVSAKNKAEERTVLNAVEDDALDSFDTPAVPLVNYAKELATVPEFARLGKVFCSSTKPYPLTEKETEYYVECVKHVFEEHVVFQFNVSNTIEDQLLEQVTMQMECEEEIELEEEFSLPAESAAYGAVAMTYVCFQRDPEAIPSGTFKCTLKFSVKDVDVDSGEADDEGYPDEYSVDDVDHSSSDYMRGYAPPSFKQTWTTLGEANEVQDQYELETYETIQAGVDAVIEFMGMSPNGDTLKVPDKVKSHTVLLGGIFVGNVIVLARANVAKAAQGVLLSLQIRSENGDISEIIAGSVG